MVAMLHKGHAGGGGHMHDGVVFYTGSILSCILLSLMGQVTSNWL